MGLHKAAGQRVAPPSARWNAPTAPRERVALFQRTLGYLRGDRHFPGEFGQLPRRVGGRNALLGGVWNYGETQQAELESQCGGEIFGFSSHYLSHIGTSRRIP